MLCLDFVKAMHTSWKTISQVLRSNRRAAKNYFVVQRNAKFRRSAVREYSLSDWPSRFRKITARATVWRAVPKKVTKFRKFPSACVDLKC